MFGMLVRDDQGGLGYLTRALARQLHPDVVLVVDHDPPRGTNVEFTVPRDTQVARLGRDGSLDREVRDWFVERVDVALTCETWYDPRLPQALRAAGARTLLYAMPELYDPNDPRTAADEVAWPTTWRAPADATVLPFPGEPHPYTARPDRDGPVRFLHVAATAMADRNGTALVRQAHSLAPHLDLTVVGGDDHVDRIAWEDYDVLVLPRRYGGLCLPFIEAAQHGLAIVTLDVAPQDDYGWHHDCYVPATVSRPRPMKGGVVDVWHADPGLIAHRLATLAKDRDLVSLIGVRCAWWAAQQQEHWKGWHSWVDA